jgi:hypothetical protein
MSKSYNNNEQSDMLKDLKNLPKIKAPDNFEYNLMTKIHNKKIGPTVNEELHFNWLKFFAPSALIVSLVLVFFIYLSQQNKKIISSASIQTKIETPSLVDNSNFINKKLTGIAADHISVKKEEIEQKNAKTGNSSFDTQYNPLITRKPIVLDEYISGHNTKKDDLRQGNVVREGGESSSFSGLIESKKLDQKTLKKYRAIVDSIKRADSLKKALK